MTRRKAPPVLAAEVEFAEDRGQSMSRGTVETLSPSTSEGESPISHFPTHRKNASSVDFSVSAKKRHKRSASELTTLQCKCSPKDIRLPLPLLQEESSSSMSDSEKVIRRIIEERKESLTSALSSNPELTMEIGRIREHIEDEQKALERRKKTLKQSLLRILRQSSPGRSQGSWESDGDISSEPSAQPLPVFIKPRGDNRGKISAALSALLGTRKQLRFQLTLQLATSSVPFSVLLLSQSDLGQLRGLYCFRGEHLQRLWGDGPEEISQAMVAACYRYTPGTFFLLPHRRLSVAVDAVALWQAS